MTEIEFQDGDQIIGHYGNTWTRKDGLWYLEPNHPNISTDSTMRWLMGLKIDYPKPSEPTGPKKISKSDPTTTPTYIYSYRLKRVSDG